MTPACSVVLTTYERPGHLRLVLDAYLRQQARDFELLVADDGSGPETARVVEAFAARAPFPVRHVWHARDGHRRAAILNRGIDAAASDYIIFSDADCLPAAALLGVHLGAREPARMLIGGCIRLDAATSARADAAFVASGAYERAATRAERARLYRRHLRNLWQIHTRRRRRPHNLGLNMSLWRADLYRVNGYDENFRGWGNADGDLRERLKRVGVWPKSVWHRAVVFHLDHPVEPSRRDRARNAAYARRVRPPAFAEQGIRKTGGRAR